MATTFVHLDRTQLLAGALYGFAQAIAQARSLGTQIAAVGATQVDGSNYTVFEQEFGLPTGAGSIVYGAITSANTTLSDATLTAICNRLGAIK